MPIQADNVPISMVSFYYFEPQFIPANTQSNCLGMVKYSLSDFGELNDLTQWSEQIQNIPRNKVDYGIYSTFIHIYTFLLGYPKQTMLFNGDVLPYMDAF